MLHPSAVTRSLLCAVPMTVLLVAGPLVGAAPAAPAKAAKPALQRYRVNVNGQPAALEVTGGPGVDAEILFVGTGNSSYTVVANGTFADACDLKMHVVAPDGQRWPTDTEDVCAGQSWVLAGVETPETNTYRVVLDAGPGASGTLTVQIYGGGLSGGGTPTLTPGAVPVQVGIAGKAAVSMAFPMRRGQYAVAQVLSDDGSRAVVAFTRDGHAVIGPVRGRRVVFDRLLASRPGEYRLRVANPRVEAGSYVVQLFTGRDDVREAAAGEIVPVRVDKPGKRVRLRLTDAAGPGTTLTFDREGSALWQLALVAPDGTIAYRASLPSGSSLVPLPLPADAGGGWVVELDLPGLETGSATAVVRYPTGT